MYISDKAIDSDVYTEVYVTLKDSKKYNTFTQEYKNYIKDKKASLEELGKTRKDIRYNEIVSSAKQKIADGRSELNKGKEEADTRFADAQKQISIAKEKVIESQAQIESNEKKANKEFLDAQAKLNDAQKVLDSKNAEFVQQKKNAEASLKDAKNGMNTINDNIGIVNNMIDANLARIKQNNLQKSKKQNEIKDLNDQIIKEPNRKDEFLNQIAVLNADITALDTDSYTKTQENIALSSKIEGLKSQLNLIQEELNKGSQQLTQGQTQLENAKNELALKKKEFNDTKVSTYKKLDDAKAQIIEAKKSIEDSEKTFTEEKKKVEDSLVDGQRKIEENENKLAELKTPTFYVLGRDTNIAYVNYEQDAERISKVASVFPVIFFIVAALVSLTSMTRMVEEQRSQIGTLKALGYKKISIASKYVWYASIASVVGSLIGITIGFNLLPRIVFIVYSMLYNMPPVVTEFNVEYALIAVLVSLICTTCATLLACIKELKETPASLMRPKAPKNGKRVFLERIPFIWKRLNFTKKVTARNILRYKKRFFMTVVGIAGCTALILAGFGLKDSITAMIPMQFNDIYNYKMQITLKDKVSLDEKSKFEDNLNTTKGINEFGYANQQAITFIKNNISKEGNMLVVKDEQDIGKYINLQDRKTKEKFTLKKDEVILTEKMSKMLNVKKGDTIELKDSDDVVVTVKISDITENYLMHYVYMSEDLYTKLYSVSPNYNNVFVKADDMTKEEKDIILSDILNKNEIVTNATFTTGISNMFNDAMSSLNYVVLVLIVSAGLLAFVVLYNLSNVNISERIRELATIKVLGFYDGEVSEYVYRENIILTIIGIVVGLFLGYLLNSFIITTCEIDLVMFGRSIKLVSYIFSIAITVIFTLIVNIVTHFSLKKIDMIESLKSVE
ncbi:MAG: FtsX-like permease family protein [Clostridia bacterium]